MCRRGPSMRAWKPTSMVMVSCQSAGSPAPKVDAWDSSRRSPSSLSRPQKLSCSVHAHHLIRLFNCPTRCMHVYLLIHARMYHRPILPLPYLYPPLWDLRARGAWSWHPAYLSTFDKCLMLRVLTCTRHDTCHILACWLISLADVGECTMAFLT